MMEWYHHGLLISELDQLVVLDRMVSEPGWPSLLQPLQSSVAPASRANANTSICVEWANLIGSTTTYPPARANWARQDNLWHAQHWPALRRPDLL
jgi:hypothetical protein